MKKYIFFVVGAVCLLLSSTVYAEDLKSTDANIVGHVIPVGGINLVHT